LGGETNLGLNKGAQKVNPVNNRKTSLNQVSQEVGGVNVEGKMNSQERKPGKRITVLRNRGEKRGELVKIQRGDGKTGQRQEVQGEKKFWEGGVLGECKFGKKELKIKKVNIN